MYGADFLLSSLEIDSLDNLEMPVTLHYSIEMKRPDEVLIYLNPLFGEVMKDNPFKSLQRHYPVEMPYRLDDIYILTLEVPSGYKVDEMPKQVVAKMDTEESAYFEYRITQSGNTISLRSRVKTSRTVYHPDEYVILREFFNLIVKKQNEQIVFKKIN